ncbi:MAG: hypothetical protein F2534_07220 [Actinobacteria bacterium]|uniref:Unannotated protein n=1 Tax=freshwater metagenome TaxID=449393 RepID=A0A6J6D0E6_9ZZZZ|nr:hypothetical protein [Actinomycetota bacterium]
MSPVRPLSTDTSTDVAQLLVERWRSMTPIDKFRAVDAANRSVDLLAAVGVRQRHPGASDEEVRRRVVALRIGRELSIAAYGWDPEVEGW